MVLPPATRHHAALAIRRHVAAGLSLDDYSQIPDISPRGSSSPPVNDGKVLAPDNASDPIDILRQAVLARRNILVSGGTSSGKTTLVNALLREIPHNERLITIEDTPELILEQPNVVGLIAARGNASEADITAEDLLVASMRMRPDRIILGEIRGPEATTFLRAINTGHPGSISTIHANSPEQAIDQIALLILQSGSSLAWDAIARYVRHSISVIVQMGRSAGERRIEDLRVLNQAATI